MKKSTDVLQNFFELTGNETDSLIFLKNFKSIEPEKFALIYASTEVVIESFSAFFYDLKILYFLDLFPIILVTQDSISYIHLFFKGIFGEKTEPNENNPHCDILPFSSQSDFLIRSSIQKKRIPFVIIENEDNLFENIALIANRLLTSKLLFLSVKGSIKNQVTNEKISIINFRSDHQEISAPNILSEDDKILLDSMKNLLEYQISHTMNIAITSPLTLLKELFTVNGSGTFLKKGSDILYFSTIKSLDKSRLALLLESAFRKKINPEFLDSEMDSIFLESNYRGAAILKVKEFGALLSKFAVDEIARGEGIGRDIWNEMKKKHNSIVWRAKPDNPIHKWYAKECQGMDKGKEWNIYWINLQVEKIPQVCNYLRKQSQDFIS